MSHIDALPPFPSHSWGKKGPQLPSHASTRQAPSEGKVALASLPLI